MNSYIQIIIYMFMYYMLMLEISFTEMCTSNSLCLSPKAFWIPWSPDSHLWDWNSGKPSRISSNTFHMHQIVSEGLAKQLMKALNRSSSNNQRAHWVISCNGFSVCAIRSYPQPSLRQRRRKGGMWFAHHFCAFHLLCIDDWTKFYSGKCVHQIRSV